MNRSEFFCPHEDECNCGLLVVKDALSLMKMNLSYEELRVSFFAHGLTFFDFGISSVHVALLLKIYNLEITLRTPSKWLMRVYDYRSPIAQLKAELLPESLEALHAMNKFLKIGGNIFFTKKGNRPNLDSITAALGKNRLAIVCVSARDYYGINEDWNHYILLSRSSDSDMRFVVTDSLKELGQKYYEDWQLRLRKAIKYDWYKWSGDIIEVGAKESELKLK